MCQRATRLVHSFISYRAFSKYSKLLSGTVSLPLRYNQQFAIFTKSSYQNYISDFKEQYHLCISRSNYKWLIGTVKSFAKLIAALCFAHEYVGSWALHPSPKWKMIKKLVKNEKNTILKPENRKKKSETFEEREKRRSLATTYTIFASYLSSRFLCIS